MFRTGPLLVSHLLYTSNLAGSHSPASVTDIVRRSRVRNLASQLTGFLLFDGCCFVQMLEGSPVAVDQTWARIQQDPRHEAARVVYRDVTAGARRFQQSLAYALDGDGRALHILATHSGVELLDALERLLVQLEASG